ncbi:MULTISPECIES: hypothetical protein [unclassified Streptomyces]|uniref:hypothetical protein n=1 Tax=unclassified Streptomyces TaxID=2593676 RepID=UPI000F022FD8|nr:hypothetical protein [Streptomyces sp. Tu 4128]
MSAPGRRRTAAQWAGRLLCWSLALAMVTAAVEALFHPGAAWWPLAWPVPWYDTPITALAWGLLRLREKAMGRPPCDDQEDLPAEDWDQAA